MTQPGRSCPLRYRYRPEVFARDATLHAETLYVIGGLYGNVESLRRLLAMQRDEEQRSGGRVELLFNGDFNWFDCDAESFSEINETVLRHAAIQGNVEAEFDSASDDNGCGCNYPDHVEQAVVERSNAIMRRLRECAADFPALQRRLGALPMYCTVEVGGQAIGVVHGDPESLSGWRFAWEAMPALAGESLEPLGLTSTQRASHASVADDFRRAGVSAFASTHTCLPFVQDIQVDGQRHLVINNGAAGMPNFKGTSFGVLTRISSRSETPGDSLYGTTLNGLRFDALPIRYDQAAWMHRFLSNWPAGSPAHTAYFNRITEGPEFTVPQAVRLAGGLSS